MRLELNNQNTESEKVLHIVTTRSTRPTNLLVEISPTRYIRFIYETCKVCKPDQFI